MAVQITIFVEYSVYSKLSELARKRSTSVEEVVKELVYRGLGIADSTSSRSVNRDEVVDELRMRVEQLSKEVGRMEIDLALVLKRLERLEKTCGNLSS